MKEVYQIIKDKDERDALKNIVNISFDKIKSISNNSEVDEAS